MKSRPRLAAWLLAGNLLLAGALSLSTLTNLSSNREVDLDRGREATENLARALSTELTAEMRLVGNALSTIARRAADDAATAGLPALLREQEQLLPFVRALHATNAQGTVIMGLPPQTAPFSVADRDYFQAARKGAALVLSEPLQSRASGDWCLIVARRLQGSDGSFRGIAYAVLSTDHFNALFRKFSLGRDGAISLRTDSLRLLARYSAAEPASSKGLGGQEVSAELKEKLALNRDSGWYITPTALDGIERVTAYQHLQGYPLLVLAGLSTEHYLAPWKTSARRQWSFTATVVLIAALGSLLLLRQQGLAYAARDEAARLASEQRLLLENDLVGMLRVRDRRILWANRAAARMLGRSPAELTGASTRLLYLDDDSFVQIGARSRQALRTLGRFNVQLQVCGAGGRAMWMDFSGGALSETESIWMLVDIDALKHSEAQARRLALYDPLTGLANRRLLEQHLAQILAHAQRTQQAVAVAYVDLDRFKPVNDQHGHQAGDEVLRTTALRLSAEIRANDIVARTGGDEFVMVLTDVESLAAAQAVLQRCAEAVRQPVVLTGGARVSVGCSIGLALSSGTGDSGAELLAQADQAMYAAKHGNAGRIVHAPPPPLPHRTDQDARV